MDQGDDQRSLPGAHPGGVLNGAPRGRPLALRPLLDEHDAGPDEYDALRDLFLSGGPLGPAAHGAPAAPATTQPPAINGAPAHTHPKPDRTRSLTVPVEGLILGHLPVFGPAWVSQYARSLVEEAGGAIGLIRIRAGQAMVDVYGDPGMELAEQPTLEDAIACAVPAVTRWLIRLDETSEPELAESARIDRITLLTGVDEAAKVACYGTLKRLVQEDADGAPSGPSVRLAIMGASPERAGPVVESLARAARTFLGRRIEAGACQERISPGRAAAVFRGSASPTLEGLLDIIAGARDRPRTPTDFPPAPPTSPNHPPGPSNPTLPTPATARAGPMGPPVKADPAPTTTEPGGVTALPALSPFPHAAGASTPAVPITPGAGSALWSLVGGLRPLAARCPHTPEIELAFDSSGVLHLLARAGGGPGGGEDGAVAQLTAAAAWAGVHLSLLALTAPESKLLTGPVRPVLHLATRQASAVRALLDTELRLHLLAAVVVDGREACVCVALN